MRSKKLLSTIVASALVTATVAMPVMAADGGELDVPVKTKTAVIRVKVPTSMDIAVNQYQMGDAGSQIYASDFDMENRSQVAVKVNVTSTATLKNTTKLLETKAAAKASTKAGEAWLAVAAQTGAGAYGTIADLTESDANVSTFSQSGTSATASQTFYLKEGSAEAYKLLNAGQDAGALTYAQFYELKAETVADAPALATLIGENDIYVATGTATDNQTLTKKAKGGSHSYDAGEVYYTIENMVPAGTIDPTKLYVYADDTADASDGKAGFRYIGSLAADQSWSNEDISNIKIKYDIMGVLTEDYTAKASDCTYGLYIDPSTAPSIATTNYTMSAGNAVTVTVDLGTDNLAATGIESITYTSPSGATKTLPTTDYTFAGTTLTLTSGHIDAALNANVTTRDYLITFNDTAKTQVTITVAQ